MLGSTWSRCHVGVPGSRGRSRRLSTWPYGLSTWTCHVDKLVGPKKSIHAAHVCAPASRSEPGSCHVGIHVVTTRMPRGHATWTRYGGIFMRASGASPGSLTRAFTCFHMDILARFRTHFHKNLRSSSVMSSYVLMTKADGDRAHTLTVTTLVTSKN